MRALFFALAALSFFAAFSAYAEDKNSSIEEFQRGYGLDDTFELGYGLCMSACLGKQFIVPQCRCGCKHINGKLTSDNLCTQSCKCSGMPLDLCFPKCKRL